MDEPVFPDKSHLPEDADVAKVLGRAKRHWDDLKTCALEANPDAAPEWKYYMKKTGWAFLLRGKRRNVLWRASTTSANDLGSPPDKARKIGRQLVRSQVKDRLAVDQAR